MFFLGKMFKTKKAQTAGLITGLVFGVASLVIAVIIAFVIVSTLNDADLLSENRDSGSVVNESGNITNASSAYTLAGASVSRFIPGSISVSVAYNGSVEVVAANYSISNAGIVTNATKENFPLAVNFTYTYSLYNEEEVSSDALSANFTKGVDNVSSKIPTILLVAAIVLILGVLVLLVGAWQRMRMGGGGI